MSAKKRLKAENIKEQNKITYFAKLRNCPTSPRKMRIVADLIRGIGVEEALHILKTSTKESSIRLRKLLLSAIDSWQQKNENSRVEKSNLFVKNIFVDQGRSLKRLRTAPQGRAHRIQKRSNHVTLILGDKLLLEEEAVGSRQ